MIRIARLLAWATATAVLAWAIAPAYQPWLAALANHVLQAVGASVRLQRLTLPVPYDLGLFLALCLASTRAPRSARTGAILVGIPTMVALEVLVVVAGVTLESWCRGHAVAAEIGARVNSALLHSVQLTNALLVWLLLLGHRELPSPPPRLSRSRGAAGKGRG